MEIKVLWMYPDILNLHGDRGNIMALCKIAESLSLGMDIVKVNNYKELPDLKEIDFMFFGAGQTKDLANVIADMSHYKNELELYVKAGGHVLATGSTECVFGRGYVLRDGTKVKGLGLINMTAKELNRTKTPFVTREVYGDDILWKTKNGIEIVGCQIQRFDINLKNKSDCYGDLIYGYGNNLVDGIEGAVYNNLHCTNTVGPLFSCNPWLAVEYLNEILSKHGKRLKDYNEDKIPFMEYAKNSLELKKKYTREKMKQKRINYTGC